MVRNHSHYKHKANFTFHKPSDFSFIQLINDNIDYEGKKHVRVQGEVNVMSSTEVAESDIHSQLEFLVSDASLIGPQLSIATESSLTINPPRFSSAEGNQFPGATSDQPFMFIFATIWVSPGITLDTFRVSTESLSIAFHPNLNYTVSSRTHISSKSGHITGPLGALYEYKKPLCTRSRETIIDTGSGSIQGTYSLYDLLSISSSSGSINVNIEPKDASSSSSKPARLRIITSSGSIQAYVPFLSASLPNRTYETDISSTSGSIDATLFHGKRTSLHTSSGRISASLSPYGPNTSRSDLDVHTMAGSIDVAIEPSLSDPSAPLRLFYASYRAGSASLRLRYPAQWEGVIEGRTGTGSMRINWGGLQIVRDDKSFVGRSIKGVKGEGEGLSRFQVGSGSVDLSG
jgi:hypothetical protein